MNRRDTVLVQKAQRGSGKPKARGTEVATVAILRLYIAGGAPNSVQAIANLEAICRRYLKDGHKLEVVDILEQPRHALREVKSRASAGSRVAANEAVIANNLLAALPRAEYQHLLAGLEPVTLKVGEVLHEQGVPIRYVYFPVDSVISLLTTVKGRAAMKVGLVGHEGMVGSSLALGIHTSSHRALVQGTGTAMRMETGLFRKEILQNKPLQQALYHYKHALIGQIGQFAACNQFHSVQARFARYLLMTGDCARSREIRLTHEFLARMLGVRRVGVTMAANALQKRKLIKCGRGKITILDLRRLRAASCECYQIIKRIQVDSAYA